MTDEYDNDGCGPCPVCRRKGTLDKDGDEAYVSNGTCEVCGEDFTGPEWQEPPDLKLVDKETQG